MDQPHLILYLIACPIGWYLFTALEYALNGGQLGHHPLFFPFQCFAEDIKCYWFGGQKHRLEFIRLRCEGDGSFGGSTRSYTYREVRDNNLYEEVFWEMCGGKISFWSRHVSYFFLGPVPVVFLLAIAVTALIVWPIDKLCGNKLRIKP